MLFIEYKNSSIKDKATQSYFIDQMISTYDVAIIGAGVVGSAIEQLETHDGRPIMFF